MKEVKEARKQQEKLLERIEAQIAYYDDILRFETGGDTTEKKTMTLILPTCSLAGIVSKNI